MWHQRYRHEFCQIVVRWMCSNEIDIALFTKLFLCRAASENRCITFIDVDYGKCNYMSSMSALLSCSTIICSKGTTCCTNYSCHRCQCTDTKQSNNLGGLLRRGGIALGMHAYKGYNTIA